MPTPISLASPVSGRIQARTETWNRTSYIVTSTLAEHRASGRGLGTDFGNGKCGGTIYAMGAGRLNRWRDPGGALVMRIKHGGTGWSTGYAHVSTFLVADNTDVSKGQAIATLGKTGATACHLHADLQWFGVHYEVYDYLEQNQEDDMAVPGTKPASPPIGTLKMPPGHSLISPTIPNTYYPQPNGGTFNVIAALDLKDANGKPVDIGGNQPPLNNRDQVYLVDAPNFGATAYALRVDGVFTPTANGDAATAAKAVAAAAAKEAAKFV